MFTTILRDRCALIPDRPVLAGISGGPDSLCLLGILHSAGYRVIVAHFDHQLRAESKHEAEMVSAVATKMGVPFIVDAKDVRRYAAEERLSIEEAARTLRYRFLFSAARQEGAQAVVVGHTADDQVETILMHFLRGTGLTGLTGMGYRSILPSYDPEIPLVRPLLMLRRTETEAYCKEHGLEAQYDPSNADETYLRNRLRHALLPELEKYNPNIKEALLRMSTALQDDQACLREILDQVWTEVVNGQGTGWIAFDQQKFAQLNQGTRRNMIRRGVGILQPGKQDTDFEALHRAAGSAEALPGKKVDLCNGLYITTEDNKIYLATGEADLPTSQWPVIREETAIHGPRVVLENGWVLTVEEVPFREEEWRQNRDDWSAWLDAELAGEHLTIRPRRNGDRFQPLGMEDGSMKVSDFFVNVKLPQRAREHWPLVLVKNTIAWVPGFRLAQDFRISKQTKRVIKLNLKRNRAV